MPMSLDRSLPSSVHLVSLHSQLEIKCASEMRGVGISMCFSPQYPGLVGPGRAVERKLINLLFIREV